MSYQEPIETAIVRESLVFAKELGVEVLLAVEAGSRAWGFPSPDSDYDVRMIYVRPVSWYLSLDKRRDTIETTIQSETGKLDVVGWDLSKALKAIRAGGAPIAEWLRSPTTYYDGRNYRDELLDLLKRRFDVRGALSHYLNVAVDNLTRSQEEGGLSRSKQFCYAIRCVLAAGAVVRHGQVRTIAIQELLRDAEANDPSVSVIAPQIRQFVAERGLSLDRGLVPTPLDVVAWANCEIARLSKIVERAPTNAKHAYVDEIDQYFVSQALWTRALAFGGGR